MSSAEDEYKDLDKIGCARQFESELSLHSLALFLQSAKVRHVGTGHAWTLSPNYLYNRSLLHYYCFYYTIETFYKLNRSFQLRPQMIFISLNIMRSTGVGSEMIRFTFLLPMLFIIGSICFWQRYIFFSILPNERCVISFRSRQVFRPTWLSPT